MQEFKQEASELISRLKEFGLIALKTELEGEGASFGDVSRFKNFANMNGLDCSVKIGGVGALNDLINMKEMGVRSIVAPMVESAYAVYKFVESVKKVYTDSCPRMFINIETLTGLENLDKMFESEVFSELDGVVFGRHDMINSFAMPKSEVESEHILNIAKEVSQKSISNGKSFNIGGAILPDSAGFILELQPQFFETRHCIFWLESCNNPREAISLALQFEQLWIEEKVQKLDSDAQRLKEISALT